LTAGDAVAVDALDRRKKRQAAGLIDDDREAFLAVGNDEQIVDQALVPLGKRHTDTTTCFQEKREPTSRVAQRRPGETNTSD
jgi:hypothetical protein